MRTLPTATGCGDLVITGYSRSDRGELAGPLSDPILVDRLYPQVLRPPPLDSVIDDWANSPSGPLDAQWVIRSKDDSLLGCVRLEKHELSYLIGRQFWGRGHGRQALRWITDNGLRRQGGAVFYAVCERGNVASMKILESAGFAFAGISNRQSPSKTLLSYMLRT